MKPRFERAQTLLEYTIVLVIIVAALLTMNVYLRRGLQGRWKESVDQLGEQYNPGQTNSMMTQRMTSTSSTRIQAVRDKLQGAEGYYTMRNDNVTSTETRNASAMVGL